MAEGTTIPDETQELTDGFNLIIDAMRLNGVETIYGVPGIGTISAGWHRLRAFAFCPSVMNRMPATPRHLEVPD